jgi:hypothetical protein
MCLQNYREKVEFVVFKLNIPIRERAKIVHNPDLLNNSFVFIFGRHRNFHFAVGSFNIPDIVHQRVEHQNHLRERREVGSFLFL